MYLSQYSVRLACSRKPQTITLHAKLTCAILYVYKNIPRVGPFIGFYDKKINILLHLGNNKVPQRTPAT